MRLLITDARENIGAGLLSLGEMARLQKSIAPWFQVKQFLSGSDQLVRQRRLGISRSWCTIHLR
jgi:hypothetical protein